MEDFNSVGNYASRFRVIWNSSVKCTYNLKGANVPNSSMAMLHTIKLCDDCRSLRESSSSPDNAGVPFWKGTRRMKHGSSILADYF